jgi:hypothetical protein
MSTHIIDAGDVIKSHRAVFVYIKFLIGLADDANSEVVQVTLEGAEELFEGNGPALVLVKDSENTHGLFLGEINTELLQTPVELVDVDLLIAILVNSLEEMRNSANAEHADLLQTIFDSSNQILESVFRGSFSDWLS